MGEIVAAAITAHQPAIMLPEEIRRAMNGGNDTTLVSGLNDMKARLLELNVDTLVIFDTHWFTTTDHIVAGAPHYSGIYTSDELPTVIAGYEYDFKGAPELAAAIEACGKAKNQRVLNATDAHIAKQYPTINMVHFLRESDQKILSVGTNQTAESHNFLEFGAVIGEAVSQVDGKVALLAAGGMSHTFPKMDDAMNHMSMDPANVISAEARDIDARILDLWAEGNHAAVIDMYDEYRPFKPEGFFGHYLMTVGALGAHNCRAKGSRMSDYENAFGTGQVHVWFNLEQAA